MTAEIKVGRRIIGIAHPVYVIAEMSANHHQNFEQAVKIIHAAKDAGVDAVKLQTYTPDTITIACDRPEFRIAGTIWNGRNLYELYGEAYTPWEWQPRLKQVANDLGLDLFSTPFDCHCGGFSGKDECAGPQVGIVRTGGYSPDSKDGAHRQALDHVHRHGDGGGN